MEFQLSYFKSWKMMLWKCCTQYASKFGKLSSSHRKGKGQLSFQSQRKAMSKNAQTTTQLYSSHTLAKWCSKFSKPGFNNTWTMNFQMFKLDLKKAEEPEIKLPISVGSLKSKRVPKNHLLLLYWLCPKSLCESQKAGKFWKRWEYQTTWPASWEICMQVRKKQQLELDMEQQAGSKPGKEYIKAVYCHPSYLTYMQSTSCEMPGWMKHKLESRLPGEISITSDMQITLFLWQKAKKNYRASWWKWKRRVKELA